MGFGNNKHCTFFKLKNGKVVVSIKSEDEDKYTHLIEASDSTVPFKNDDGIPMLDIEFGNFEGYLVNIAATETNFGKGWNITFRDEQGEEYIWSTYYDGQIFQSFINSLASIKGPIGLLKLQPWLGKDKKDNERTKLTIYHNGSSKEHKLSWEFSPEQLPKVAPRLDADGEEILDAKGNVVFDTRKRMLWLVTEVDKIVKKVNPQSSQKTSNDGSQPPSNGNGNKTAVQSKKQAVPDDDEEAKF